MLRTKSTLRVAWLTIKTYVTVMLRTVTKSTLRKGHAIVRTFTYHCSDGLLIGDRDPSHGRPKVGHVAI